LEKLPTLESGCAQPAWTQVLCYHGRVQALPCGGLRATLTGG
jgi:hypothetical protein